MNTAQTLPTALSAQAAGGASAEAGGGVDPSLVREIARLTAEEPDIAKSIANRERLKQLENEHPVTFRAAMDAALDMRIAAGDWGVTVAVGGALPADAVSFDVSEFEPATPITAAETGNPYAATDLGNAERFASDHRESVRYDAARGWLCWDGRRWVPDATLHVQALAAKTVRNIRHEAAAVPTDTKEGRAEAEALFKHALRSEGRDRLAAMVDVAKAQPGIAVAVAEIDRDPWVLNVANGTIDLRTGKLRPHDRRDLITRLSPVAYRPGLKDARFTAFLHDATGGDTVLAVFLQKICGYILTGDTSEEKAFFWYGGTATGKSTLLEAERACLGDYAKTIDPAMLCRQKRQSGAATPELAALAGVRLAAGSELEDGQQLGEAFVKSITGGEGITARHLYGAQFDFVPQFKIVLALNHCPRASADDPAVWRRLIRIGIDKPVPPERLDRTLKPYLRNPHGGAPAVLAWAVEGCLLWQQEGLEPLPEAVRANTDAYRRSCDPLAAFIEDCITVNRYAWTTAAAIMAAYREHAEHEGTPERYQVSARRIGERLRDLGATAERRHEGRGWQGVELNEVRGEA